MVNKIKEKIKNNKILIIVLISFLAIILGVGISYAFYAAIIKGNETSTTLQLEAGTLSINYDGGNVVVAKGFLPGDQPFATKTFTLTGNNDSELNMPYTFTLVVDANTFNNGSIFYSLGGENTSNNGRIVEDSYNMVSNSGLVFGPGYFAPGATNAIHTYTFKFYFPDDGTDQSDEMNRVFEAHIKIEGAKITPEIPGGNENLFADGTIAGKIIGGPNKTMVRNYVTNPGAAQPTTNEGLIQNLDDLGSTYYFRGTVENNYVMFANMCWRVVRIMGDGNVKITLDNVNGACSEATSTSAYYGDETFYYNGSSLTPSFNSTDAYATLVNFYDEKFNSANQKFIVDSIWCQDFTFAANTRLYNNSPSFMCPDSSNSDVNEYRNSLIGGSIKKGNKSLSHSIGLLTSDEIVFAGATSAGLNDKTYLYKTSYGQVMATMSPSTGDNYGFNIFYLWADGGSFDDIAYAANESSFYMRPTIVINGKANVLGTGTINDPYIVS